MDWLLSPSGCRCEHSLRTWNLCLYDPPQHWPSPAWLVGLNAAVSRLTFVTWTTCKVMFSQVATSVTSALASVSLGHIGHQNGKEELARFVSIWEDQDLDPSVNIVHTCWCCWWDTWTFHDQTGHIWPCHPSPPQAETADRTWGLQLLIINK